MNIHEYQAKKLLSEFHVQVNCGAVAETVDEAIEVAKNLNTDMWVVKAQIHAGGRGKAGGVKVCKTLDEVQKAAEQILGKTLVTHQTDPKGQLVRKIYIEAATKGIAKEFYLSLVLNRNTSQVCIIASSEGGVEIEKVAEEEPSKVLNLSISPASGIQPYHARLVAKMFGILGKAKEINILLNCLYDAYVACDCSLIEINPLVFTNDNDLVALDAKISFDDNALFRHESLQLLHDEHEEDAAELEAKEHDLNYVKLDGTIGCLVNGAGLAMATMDIIKSFGGCPANFLDVGGSADKERVAKAFQIILKDKGVKTIFVNIFGGIMRCDIIAQGIIDAAKEMNLAVPLVVRLQGTNKEIGSKLLQDSKLNIIAADDLSDAAQKAVQLARG